MKLSIITVNLNNAEGLQKTIESVVTQTFTDFEYIIIDGGSTDGSVDIIKQYTDKITYWVSEPDNGIFNAMNKGILQAKGEYSLFLNSGDWLVDKNVIFDFVEQKENYDIITGDIYLHEKEEITLRNTVDEITYGNFFTGSIPHPASFIRRSLFDKYDLYNEKHKIVSDWEFFFITLVLNHVSFFHFKRTISYFDLTGISNKSEYRELQKIERDEVLSNYLPLVYKSYKKIYEENISLKSHEKEYREYINLKNSGFGIIVKLLLFLKKMKRK